MPDDRLEPLCSLASGALVAARTGSRSARCPALSSCEFGRGMLSSLCTRAPRRTTAGREREPGRRCNVGLRTAPHTARSGLHCFSSHLRASELTSRTSACCWQPGEDCAGASRETKRERNALERKLVACIPDERADLGEDLGVVRIEPLELAHLEERRLDEVGRDRALRAKAQTASAWARRSPRRR